MDNQFPSYGSLSSQQVSAYTVSNNSLDKEECLNLDKCVNQSASFVGATYLENHHLVLQSCKIAQMGILSKVK